MEGPRPDRPLFSPGQYIGAADLNEIVDYARDSQRRLQLSGIGWGIGVGLDLIERPAQGNTVELWIEPGIAGDGYGRLIFVPTPAMVSPDLFAGFAGTTGSPITYPVWLRYDEPQQQAQAGANPCSSGTATLIRESFAIEAGRIAHFTDRQSGITIGGAPIADPRDMLRAVNQNAAVVLDGAAPQQTFPADADKPYWLVPVGLALWDGANFVQRSQSQLIQSRAFRRYIGAIAESVLAADGVLRLRDRQVDMPPGLNEDQLEQNSLIKDVDLQIDAQTGRCVGNELVWVEGKLRLTDDARLFGSRLEWRASDGSEAGGAPLFARRAMVATNDKGGQDLQIAVGMETDGTDRLTIGPIDTSTDPNGVLQERVIVRSDGEVRIDGAVGIGFTNEPRTTLEVRGNVSGPPSTIDQHVAIIENYAKPSASVLALGIHIPSIDGTSNLITFFNNSKAIGSIKATGFQGPYPTSPPLNVVQPDGTPNDSAVLSTPSGVTMVTNSADFAECLPRASNSAPIGPGRIVGAFAGRVSLATEGADSLLVTTDRPAVLGNAPPEGEAPGFEAVALIGQVAVLVEGPVNAGDFILPSGRADGTGRAVSPSALAPGDVSQIVGRAWESSDVAGPKRINAIVGTGANVSQGLAAMLAAQGETIRALSAEVTRLKRAVDG